MPKIIIHLPDGSSAKYGLNGATFKIGRAADNDIVLPPGAASSYHAVLQVNETGDFTVTDLESTNRTQVNGRAVHTRELGSGDVLLFGDVRAEYESEVGVRRAPVEEQPTRIYEQGVPAVAARPTPVVLAPAAVQRPVSTTARRGSHAEEGGCFAMVVFALVLPAAFFGGLVLRHHQEKGAWFWDYLQQYIHS